MCIWAGLLFFAFLYFFVSFDLLYFFFFTFAVLLYFSFFVIIAGAREFFFVFFTFFAVLSFFVLYFCTLSFVWTVHMNFRAKSGICSSKTAELWVFCTFVLLYFVRSKNEWVMLNLAKWLMNEYEWSKSWKTSLIELRASCQLKSQINQMFRKGSKGKMTRWTTLLFCYSFEFKNKRILFKNLFSSLFEKIPIYLKKYLFIRTNIPFYWSATYYFVV